MRLNRIFCFLLGLVLVNAWFKPKHISPQDASSLIYVFFLYIARSFHDLNKHTRRCLEEHHCPIMQSVVHHLSRWDNAWKMDPVIEMTVVHSKGILEGPQDPQVVTNNEDETLLLGFAGNESMFDEKETENTQSEEGETFSSSKTVSVHIAVVDYDSDSDGEESEDDVTETMDIRKVDRCLKTLRQLKESGLTGNGTTDWMLDADVGSKVQEMRDIVEMLQSRLQGAIEKENAVGCHAEGESQDDDECITLLGDAF